MQRIQPGLTISDEMKSDRRQEVKKGCCSTCGVFQTEDNSTRRNCNDGRFDTGCKECTALTSHVRNLLDQSPEKLHRLMDKHLEIARRIYTVIHTEGMKPYLVAREHIKSNIKFIVEEEEMSRPPIDETDNVYGLLTVKKRVESGKYGEARWLCKCACGGTKITSGTTLRKGECISCGCELGRTSPSEYRTNREGVVNVDIKRKDTGNAAWRALGD